MAEDLNQEPTAEEKAKFEQDVLKAAEEAMKMEAEANKPRQMQTLRTRSVILSRAQATSKDLLLNSLRNPLPKTRLQPSRQPSPMQTTATCA